jgi:hypothetical protein
MFKMIQEAGALQPLELQTESNVRDMVIRDRRLALRMMTDELHINKETVVKPAMKISGRGGSMQSSSHTDSQASRSNRDSQHCKTPSRLVKPTDCIVTADESRVFQYDRETKRQSMQWTPKSSPKPKSFVCKRPRSNYADHIFLTNRL